MNKVISLRKKYPKFLYENFSYQKYNQTLSISFLFKIPPDIEFNPTIVIENIDDEIFFNLNSKVVDNFIFNLGLIEMISYWKATCSPEIEIKAGFLNQTQATWWKNLIKKGLGEFFYQNKINLWDENFVSVESTTDKSFPKDDSEHQNRYLVLNGGGRDTAVTLEELKDLKKDFSILMLNPTKAAQELVKVSGIQNTVIVKREIDKRLLELNSKGYLNGHTPFSAYLAFLSVLCAFIFDHKYVVASNERSANEGNIEFSGERINHQYSKSFKFENSFRQYVKVNLSQNIEYFSLLRPLWELQISRIFANYPQYFSSFKSCNRGQKDNTWCGKCPKCLSIYITLYPFMDERQLEQIFQTDLFAKEELLDLLLHLTGNQQPKPFECVGTSEELQQGLRLSINKLETQNKPLPFLLRYAREKLLNTIFKNKIMESWDEAHFVPKDIAQNLKVKIYNEN